MRVEYNFELDRVDVPRFSVEATEGPAKLFTLATLLLNIFGAGRACADIVFHSPNENEPARKRALLQEILESAPGAPPLSFEPGASGRLGGTYYEWLRIRSNGGAAGG